MIALGLDNVNVAQIANPQDVRHWEEQARRVNHGLVDSRHEALRLLESPDENVRRLALLSFRYRWSISVDDVAGISAMAAADLTMENRLAALSLLYLVFVRAESLSLRADIADAIRSVAEDSSQASDIGAAARSYLSVIGA
jgi:hypothetical protein